jgi:hypothetical protein
MLSHFNKFEFVIEEVNNRHPESIRIYLVKTLFIIRANISFLRLKTYIMLIEIIINANVGYIIIGVSMSV